MTQTNPPAPVARCWKWGRRRWWPPLRPRRAAPARISDIVRMDARGVGGRHRHAQTFLRRSDERLSGSHRGAQSQSERHRGAAGPRRPPRPGAGARRPGGARRDHGPAARPAPCGEGPAAGEGHPLHLGLADPEGLHTRPRIRCWWSACAAAGAIFIGKTNTPEFGLGSHTYNPVYGATHNAYDQSKSAGGSSGGAAVSLALRMLPVADGSDYGGSLRNPAGWNNVFGFRTSFGIVPVAGERSLAAVDGRRRADGAQRFRSRPAAVGAGRLRSARAACRWRAKAAASARRWPPTSKASASAG